MVQHILRRVRADVTLRLGNLQVVNGYGDGEHRFAHDWLRRNERDTATLAWEVAAERERLGFGTIKVLHQLVLEWWQRGGIGPLQWHFLQCMMAPEREVRRPPGR